MEGFIDEYLEGVLSAVAARFAVLIELHEGEAKSFPVAAADPLAAVALLAEDEGALAPRGQHFHRRL